MKQTLLYIPHDALRWLLVGWMVFSVVFFGWLARRHGWNKETRSYLPILILVGAVIAFVLPRIADAHGLPIRGYGVMMLLAIVLGVGLAAHEARRVGLNPELIFSLAVAMTLAGIVGARLFYVIQYWDQFRGKNLGATLAAVVNVTQGGLVVYGSLLGALLAAFVFLRRHNLPMLAMADLIAPSLVLGLAIGRLGCLLNGCCYGGLCPDAAVGVTFPQGSPPYVDQLANGELLGLRTTTSVDKVRTITSIQPASLAERDMHVGDQVKDITVTARLSPGMEIQDPDAIAVIVTTDHGTFRYTLGQLPARSRQVRPAQIYSAINAGLLCFFLWSFYPFRQHDGESIALLLTIYPMTRFLLEMVRVDEVARWGTSLTISQIVSLSVLVLASALWFYVLRQPKGTSFFSG